MFRRWFRFFLSRFWPLGGWRARVVRFHRVFSRGGLPVWKVPGRPDVPPIAPFPMEWVAATVYPPGEGPPRGWEALTTAPCSACGTILGTNGVRCARCGVLLHEGCAGLEQSVDVPACAACRSRVRAVA